MAKATDNPTPIPPIPAYSEDDKSKARQWFKKAIALRDQRSYDYAIESLITGLGFWPEAVEEGHKPLWSLAIQRTQAGGKKTGMMDAMKKPTSGKDAKAALLNAESLLARDPTSATYLDALVKNAVRADLPETLMWIGPKALDSLVKEKKPNLPRFKAFRELLVEMAERSDARTDPTTAAWCYDHAVQSIEHLMALSPGDMALRDEHRDLSGRLTIIKGKYGSAENFRESVKDSDKQKMLHDAERTKQSESTLDDLIRAARAAFEAEPTVSQRISAYVDALLKPERAREEALAIEVLRKSAKDLQNYSFKMRADDILLRQLARQRRALKAQADRTGADEDAQQSRLAAMEEAAVELDIYRERVQNYPTDLRLKYRLGEVMFRTGDYDDAIPVLQTARNDPKNRTRCDLLMGRCFMEKGLPGEAAGILTDALAQFEPTGDDTGKELLYRLGLAHKAAGEVPQARAAFSKLLRQDYTYAEGDARRQMEELK